MMRIKYVAQLSEFQDRMADQRKSWECGLQSIPAARLNRNGGPVIFSNGDRSVNHSRDPPD